MAYHRALTVGPDCPAAQRRDRLRSHLAHARELAALEHYVRAFLDEDAAMFACLRDVQEIAPDFVELLLRCIRVSTSKQSLGFERLVEPLTDREMDVLPLLAAGMTNKAIAEARFIAPGTVKQRLKNITASSECITVLKPPSMHRN